VTADLPLLAHLSDAARDAPWLARGVAGAAGLLLLGFGGRLYRVALLLGAFAAGAAGSLLLLGAARDAAQLPVEPVHSLIAALVGGVVLAAIAAAVHRLALLALGALAGLVLASSLASLLSVAWWVPLAAAAVGAVAFLLLEKALLRVVTALVGAWVLAWALGRPDAAWLVVPAWLVGAVFQTWSVRR
jgi:hypothetical protein